MSKLTNSITEIALIGVGGLLVYGLVKNQFSPTRDYYNNPTAGDLYNNINRAANSTTIAANNAAKTGGDIANIAAGGLALIDVPLDFLSKGASNTMDILRGDWGFLNLNNNAPTIYGGNSWSYSGGGGGGR